MKMLSLLSAIFLFSLALISYASPPAVDSPAASVTPMMPAISPSPVVKPEPKDVLKSMVAYLRTLDRFTVRVEKITELILPTDQRLHADQTMEVAIQKPNRLRIDYQNLSGGRQLFYDGETFALYTPAANVYASAAAAPTIDETLDLLETQYGISVAIADLLVANPDSRLVQNLTSATYVGRILVRGIPCHHLAFQTPELDWEIWIEDGPKPLPRRLLLTDKSVEGAPQMTASLNEWNLAPQFAADFFSFKPPQSVEKIKFLNTKPAVQPTKAAQ